MSTQEEIRQTLARYCMLCDDGRFEEWSRLFTQDARFHVMGATHHGRAAVQAFIEAGLPPERRGKHMGLGAIIQVDEVAGTARAWSDFAFVDQAGVVTRTGRYHDELVRGNDGVWRFGLREIVFPGQDPELTSVPPSA